MEKVILKVETRDDTGKAVAKKLRKEGLIPAVVYRGGKDAMNLKLPSGDMEKVLHTKAGENVIITLKVSGAKATKDKTVVVKEIQRDPVKDSILHVDFNEISLTEMIKVNVPLAAKGEAPGVKNDGGTLEHVIWELQVECLPTDIPEKVDVDVSNMNIGDSVLVKNLMVPEGVKVLNDPELIALIVKPPKVEVPKEEVEAEGAAEPELIRKKKEEGEPEEGAKEASPKEAKKEEKKEEKK
ncbi:MAG: 50S ribosomal protein L25 [Candidatus Omnitrophica bacterium]|nr:50S ribosomal protein L25 [Candidatus Omnitrophota bacterium]